MINLTAQVLGLLLLGATPYESPQAPYPLDISTRLQQLEQEAATLRAELDRLLSQQPPLPVGSMDQANTSLAVDSPATAPATAPGTAPASTPSMAPADIAPATSPGVAADTAPQYLSLDQLRAELSGDMKKYAWTKGDFTIVPYGVLWATATYETERTNAGDYVLYVYPKNVEGHDAFHVDAKSTRLGLDITGPRIPSLCCAQSGGKVEIDFQRNIDTENRPGILLRHAYAEVKNDEFRLLAGQTWDVISPLYPGMLMYSVGWGGGNIGYRRAQMRGERYLDVSDTFLLTTQASINVGLLTVGESATNFSGDHSGWPVLMGRVAATLGNRGPGCRPIEIGFSGHVGEENYTFKAPTWPNPVHDLARPSWSFNVDVKMPVTQHFGVQGELFTGANLGPFFGGILQGIDIGTPATPGSRDAIRSRGGWIDVWCDLTPHLHSHVGYGIDDPIDSDLTTGRTYNDFWFSNVSYDVTAKFLVGFEVSSWKTLWIANQPGESVSSAFVVKYGF